MDDFSEENLAVYEEINKFIRDGFVKPYEDSLLLFLANHTEKWTKHSKSYFELLTSTYSIGKCDMFARYLALGMEQPFHLYKGKLGSLYDGKMQHEWIETEDYVYDVTFIGKWPKDLYYHLFKPVVETEINLENDKEYLEYKSNTIEVTAVDQMPLLKYIDWHCYMLTASYAYTQYFGLPVFPTWHHFPQDEERLKQKEFVDFINREWKKYKVSDSDVIPAELFSDELSEYIDNKNFKTSKKDLYIELIKFIASNRDLYEEKKEDYLDISLWRKALDGKYSGSFTMLISDISIIIKKFKEKEASSSKKLARNKDKA